MFRVGKKTDTPRPLVVKFSSVDKKKAFLNDSNGLKLHINGREIIIYCSIDRTPSQRAEHKKLVEALKAERDESNDNGWVIRNNKIVKNSQTQRQNPKIRFADLFKN